MQIIQWLLKLAYESPGETDSSTLAHKGEASSDDRIVSREIALYNNRGGRRRNFNLSSLLRRRDIAKASFYSTLGLKRLGSNRRRQHWVQEMKLKKSSPGAHGLSTCQKAESAGHVGNTKVLPISDSASLSSSPKDSRIQKRDKAKGDKKTISKMKELVRWAAAAKSDKKGKYLVRNVLPFRNRATLNAVPDDDQFSSDSPKISFRWDVESCSTTSSAYSALFLASPTKNDQCSARTGNWITTDSEFVVLEL